MQLETRIADLEDKTEFLAVREQGLVGMLCMPRGDQRVPGILVFGGSGGGVPEYEVRLLAAHGFAAFGVRYFGADGLPSSLAHIPLEYFGRAISWLQQHPRCCADGVGVVGYSRGGELALLLGANYADIRSVVAFVPSAISWGAVIRRFRDHFTHPRAWLPGTGRGWRSGHHAAWSHGGRPLPHMQPSLTWSARALLESHRRGRQFAGTIAPLLLRDAAAVQHAVIPVERINGPVLLFSGGQDEEWPSTAMAEMVMDRLRSHRHPFPDEHIRYPDAGHALPADQYREAWAKAIAFLYDQLSCKGA
jgi:pimeloyl-ACP methyl ester carboxylesterase